MTRDEIKAMMNRIPIGGAFQLQKGWAVRATGLERLHERTITLTCRRVSFGKFVIEVDDMPDDLALVVAAAFSDHKGAKQ